LDGHSCGECLDEQGRYPSKVQLGMYSQTGFHRLSSSGEARKLPIESLFASSTSLCRSIPEPVPGEVPRPHLVKLLAEMFSPDRKIVLVEGGESSGKTVLLSQFCRHFSGRVVSYFIGTDYWGSSPTRFLEDFCQQMNQVFVRRP